MILTAFAGRTVRQVEKLGDGIKVVFDGGGYLYARARGPQGSHLKLACLGPRCVPCRCEDCHGIEPAASE